MDGRLIQLVPYFWIFFSFLLLISLTLYHSIPAFNNPKESFGNTEGKGENAGNQQFLAPLAIGQQAYVMARCPL